jgi:hypothetical protein
MFMIELQSPEVLSDLSGSARRAAADVQGQRATLKSAEGTLAKCIAECSRLKSLQGSLNSKYRTLSEKLRAAKLLAMQHMSMSLSDPSDWVQWRKLRAERDEVSCGLSFVTSYSLADALRAELIAQIAERNAYADLTEATAVAQRLAMANAASAAMEYDPGAKLQVDDSWSSREMAKVAAIRTREVTELQEQLAKHNQVTDAEQSIVAPALLNT